MYKMLKHIFMLTFLHLIIYKLCSSYTITPPTITVFSPKGLDISIPDEDGIALFSFHAKINEKIKPNEPGDFHGEVQSKTNNKWIYHNDKIRLNDGDILYYWIYVQHGRLAYRLDDQQFVYSRSLLNNNESNNVDEQTETPSPIAPPTPYRPLPSHHDSCDLSKTTVNGKNVCKSTLIFEDNFNLDIENKWRHEIEIPSDTEDAEFLSYQDRSDICFIENNKLLISPKLASSLSDTYPGGGINGVLELKNCTAPPEQCKRIQQFGTILPPIVSCKLNTKNTFNFKYGRIDVRAKLPIGDWMFPQLYLEPSGKIYGADRHMSGLLRIAFIRSNRHLRKDGHEIGGNVLQGGAILTVGEEHRNVWIKSKHSEQNKHYGDDFHNYTLLWNDEFISVAIDGVSYGQIDGNFKDTNIINAPYQTGEHMAPFDKEFYISLGVGVGGISDFPDDTSPTKPWKNQEPKNALHFWRKRNEWYSTWSQPKLQIDYVKVWSL